MAPIPWSDFKDRIERLYKATRRRPSTVSKLRSILRDLESCGVRSTADLTGANILAWLESHSTLKSDTVRGNLGYIRAACHYAVEEGWLEKPPNFKRLVPRVEDPPEQPHHSLDELRRFMDVLRSRSVTGDWYDGRLFALASTVAMCALRRNEALFLRVVDVDLAARLIVLNPTQERPLKTPSSGQPVPIPPELHDVLDNWIPRTNSAWLFPSHRRLRPWFGGSNGKRPIDALRRVGEECGFEMGVTFRSLRHTWATHAESAWGLSEPVIQRIMRHTDRRTQRRYRHADRMNLVASATAIRIGGGHKESPVRTGLV
jgi:integrase